MDVYPLSASVKIVEVTVCWERGSGLTAHRTYLLICQVVRNLQEIDISCTPSPHECSSLFGIVSSTLYLCIPTLLPYMILVAALLALQLEQWKWCHAMTKGEQSLAKRRKSDRNLCHNVEVAVLIKGAPKATRQ